MSLPEQFEFHDRRVAADGAAYTYSDFEQWYGAHAKQMWEGAAATEHRHNRTSQSIQQMLRIAADGYWYNTHTELRWESATATEHSGRIDIQALPPRSQASHPTGVTVRASALPRDVTEHSPLDNITTDPATPAPALAPTPAPTPALDRPDWCERCGIKAVCDSCKRSHEQAQSPLASTEQWDIPPTATLISRNIPGPPTGPPPGSPGRGGQQPGCNATEHADSLQCYRACTGS